MSNRVLPPQVSRRDFIRRVGACLAASLLLPLSPRDLWTWRMPPSSALGVWRQDAFAARLGQVFNVEGGPLGSVPLRLVQVSEGTAKIHAGPNRTVSATNGECFLLSFVGPADRPLPERTYTFEDGQLGRFDLFIVPGTADESRQRYLAVINHVRV